MNENVMQLKRDVEELTADAEKLKQRDDRSPRLYALSTAFYKNIMTGIQGVKLGALPSEELSADAADIFDLTSFLQEPLELAMVDYAGMEQYRMFHALQL